MITLDSISWEGVLGAITGVGIFTVVVVIQDKKRRKRGKFNRYEELLRKGWESGDMNEANLTPYEKQLKKEWEQEQRENEAFRASIKRDKPTYEEWLAQREKEKKD